MLTSVIEENECRKEDKKSYYSQIKMKDLKV